MATKRQKTEVGIFLAGVMAILIAVILALSGVSHKRLDHYYVELEESVAGLTEGSRVTYRGIVVGKVLDLRVTPENKVGITLGIDRTKVTLRQGAKARYTLLSMFGPYVIDLSGGTDPDAPSLEPGSFIPAQASLMAGLEETFAETIPLTLQRVTKLIERLDMALSKVKPEDIPGIFRRTEEVLSVAAKAVEDLRTHSAELSSSLDKAIRSVQAEAEKALGKAGAAAEKLQQATDATAAEASKLLTTLQATVEGNRKSLADALKRLDDTLAQVNKQLEGIELAATTKAIREAADKLGKGAEAAGDAAKTLAAAREDIRRSLVNVERDLARALDSLDQMLRSARDLLDTLERDPSALFRGKRGGP